MAKKSTTVKAELCYSRIKKYSFFSYAVNEALHLSPNEEALITKIINNISDECQNGHDEFSRDIILAQLSALLSYAERFIVASLRSEVSHNRLFSTNSLLALMRFVSSKKKRPPLMKYPPSWE